MSRLFRFALEAGTGESHARKLAALCRYIGKDLGAHRVTVWVNRRDTLVPFVSEFADGASDPAGFRKWLALSGHEELDALVEGEGTVRVQDPGSVLPPWVIAEWDIQPFVAAPLQGVNRRSGLLTIEGDDAALDRAQASIGDVTAIVTLAIELILATDLEREHAAEAEAFLVVIEALSQSSDLLPVLAAVAQTSARITDFDRASIFLLDGDGTLRPAMSQFADGHEDTAAWERFRTIRADLPAARAVIESGEPAAYEDPSSEPDVIPAEWLEAFDIRSVLFLPLIAWERPFGVLVLDVQAPRRILSRQIRLARGVAAHGAVAVGMARLLERERQSREAAVAASETLASRERQQGAIAQLGHRALTAAGLDEVLSETVAVVSATLEVDFCEILELTKDGAELELKAAAGLPTASIGVRIPNSNASQAGVTLETRTPVVMEDVETETRFAIPPLFRKHGIVSGVSVIVGSSEEPYGVLGVHTKTRRQFAPSEVLFLQGAANVLASAADRDAAEAALRQSRHRFETILDTASDAIVSVDVERRVMLFNHAAEAMFGYAADEVLGRQLDFLVPERFRDEIAAGRFQEFADRASARDPIADRMNVTGLRSDGAEFPAAVTVSKQEVDGELMFTAIVRDMTEQRLTQQRLEHLVESKGELIASVSHELRTPLTGILGFTEVLRDRAHEFSAEEQVAMISAAAEEAADLSNIVDDLLAAARSDMGMLKVATVPVNLAAQVAQVLESREDFGRVRADVEAVRAVGDPARVRQILRNLLTNAARYGGTDVEVSTRSRPEGATLVVSDDGPGIARDEQDRVFEPFERSAGQPGLPGSVGLGLTVSRNLARLMGGELTYSYEDGRSVFELTLPLA